MSKGDLDLSQLYCKVLDCFPETEIDLEWQDTIEFLFRVNDWVREEHIEEGIKRFHLIDGSSIKAGQVFRLCRWNWKDQAMLSPPLNEEDCVYDNRTNGLRALLGIKPKPVWGAMRGNRA